MAPQDVTVVFVPGAFHSPDGYDGVIADLHAAGYNTSKVYTPSVLRNGAPPVDSIDPDVEEVKKHLRAATDAGQKVVLVMHSYGGQPGSMALKGFDQATFASQGHADGRGVVHIMYLASFMLRHGEKLSDQGMAADFVDVREDGSIFPRDPANAFYQDFESKDEVERWIADLRPWSPGCAVAALSYEPWKDIPTTYLACENDNAIPIASQKELVQRAIEAGAKDLRVITWKCGHTPFGLKPLEVSHIIRNTVAMQ